MAVAKMKVYYKHFFNICQAIFSPPIFRMRQVDNIGFRNPATSLNQRSVSYDLRSVQQVISTYKDFIERLIFILKAVIEN